MKYDNIELWEVIYNIDELFENFYLNKSNINSHNFIKRSESKFICNNCKCSFIWHFSDFLGESYSLTCDEYIIKMLLE